MPIPSWKYYESGATGWVQITNPVFSNPTEPGWNYVETSTRQKIQLADGSFAYLTPEVQYAKEPLTFTWQYQSGAAAVIDTLERITRNDEMFKMVSDVPDVIYMGKIIKVQYDPLPKGKEDYRNIIINLEQIDE